MLVAFFIQAGVGTPLSVIAASTDYSTMRDPEIMKFNACMWNPPYFIIKCFMLDSIIIPLLNNYEYSHNNQSLRGVFGCFVNQEESPGGIKPLGLCFCARL